MAHALRDLFSASYRRCRPDTCNIIVRSIHTEKAISAFEALSTAILPSHGQALQEKGYTVLDDALDDGLCTAFQQEIASLKAKGKLHLNSTHLVGAGQRSLIPKQSVYEAEMGDPVRACCIASAKHAMWEVQGMAPLIAGFQRDRTMLVMLSLFLPFLSLDSQLIKLQLNEGDGGCFPMHYDSDETVDLRRITAILYLNQAWKPDHGGELVLFPWPHPPVVLAPLHNRLVMFSSCSMLHRVMPASRERYCFTTWMSARNSGRIPTPFSRLAADVCREHGAGSPSLERLAVEPEYRKAMAKLHYADAWAQSLKDSHAASAEREALLNNHWKEVGMLKGAAQRLGLNDVQGVANRLAAPHMPCAPWF